MSSASPTGRKDADAYPRRSIQITLTSSVYEGLRQEILSTNLPPGTRLPTRTLGERYGVGLSSIREALSILSSEGLVVRRDRRGFIAAPVSEADLDDLTLARCWIYEIGLRQSIARGNTEWEEGVVLAFHRLANPPSSRGSRRAQSGVGARSCALPSQPDCRLRVEWLIKAAARCSTRQSAIATSPALLARRGRRTASTAIS